MTSSVTKRKARNREAVEREAQALVIGLASSGRMPMPRDLRSLLARLGLTQVGAARLIGIDDRLMRRSVAENAPRDRLAAFHLTAELHEATGEPVGEILGRVYGTEQPAAEKGKRE